MTKVHYVHYRQAKNKVNISHRAFLSKLTHPVQQLADEVPPLILGMNETKVGSV